MKFEKDQSIAILKKTPAVLKNLLSGISNEWIVSNEGADTFSPYDVLGHLIHGEKTDWVVRAKIILAAGPSIAFEPWNRFAQFQNSNGKTTDELLNEFESIRNENIAWLQSLYLTESELNKIGIHPVLGQVTLKNLLATWVVHDLTHIAQITRVMAKQYQGEIGQWSQFFRILNF
jgi:DinB superfamily